jgi:outer membrane protein
MRVTFLVLLLLLLPVSWLSAQEVLTLQDCIEIALKNNTTIRTNTNLNASAGQDVTASYGGILPTVNANASTGKARAGESTRLGDVQTGQIDSLGNPIVIYAVRTQPGYESNANSMNLSINQNIFDGGEWWNAIRYAKSAKRSADLNLQDVINQTVYNVQNRFFTLLMQQKLLEVNQLQVKRTKEELDKTEKMFELGAVAKVDLYRSKRSNGEAIISMLNQENAVLRAKNELNLIMGREPETPLNIDPTLELMPTISTTDTLVNKAFKNNPGLMRTEEDVTSGNLSVSRAKARLWPSLGASFSYGRRNEQFDRVYSNWDQNWTISYGVGISYNVFNGFRDWTNIQKQKLAAKNAKEIHEDTKRTLRAEIVQLTDNYNSYIEIIEVNQQNLEAAKEEYRLAEERYRIGSGTSIDLSTALEGLTRAEQVLVAAQYNARITQAQLEAALGSILQQE